MRERVFAASAILFLGLCAAVAPAAGEDTEAVPTLTVYGSARLEVAPDRLRMQFGVVSRAGAAEEAMQENAARMEKVKQALQKAGIEKGEFYTGQYRIHPEWDSPPRPMPEDWKPRITGYRVENTLMVRTGSLGMAGRLIADAVGAGADRVESLEFDLADPRIHRVRAIEEATAQARADARALANAASVKLEEVLDLRLEGAEAATRPMHVARMAEASMAAPDIVPGQVTVNANVTMSFRISRKEGKRESEPEVQGSSQK